MSNVATRLLSLILMLQSRPTWKAGDLAAELDVSERTVYRYMRMLEEIGIPLYSERGPYGGFSLVRGYKLPPLVFTAEEATVLYMGANLIRDVWGQTYGEAVTAVTAKLDNVLPDDLRGEVAQAQQSLAVGANCSVVGCSPTFAPETNLEAPKNAQLDKDNILLASCQVEG